MRRALWERLPYDETLTGLEDLDWAKRAMQLGYRIAYAPDAEVIHVHHESPRQIYNRYRREAIALKRIFPEERFHFGDFVRLFVANVFTDYGQARRAGVFRQEFTSIPTFRLMQLWGTYKGYSQRGPVTTQLRQTFYYPQSRTRLAAEHPPALNEARKRVQYAANPEEHEGD